MIKVAVVGAGLAGLYAAYSAAAHGAEVTLHEKSQIGTKHNCGEMFTEIYNSAPEKCKLNRIDNFVIKVGDDIDLPFKFSFEDESPFVMTDKCHHENIIKERCISLGVNIKEKTTTSKSLLRDSTVVNATGVSEYYGDIGKAVVYIVKRNGAVKSKKDIPYNTAFFSIREDLMGYSWVFPRGKDSLNIGEGVCEYRYSTSLMKPEKSSIIYSGGGALPMPSILDYCKNVICGSLFDIRVGNAAGLVNPIAGGGEHLAVLSGMLAGELAAKGMIKNYYKALDEIIGSEMRFGISMYEFMRKQDAASISKVLESGLINKVNRDIVNNDIRRAMGKWMTIPEVNEKEIVGFIGE